MKSIQETIKFLNDHAYAVWTGANGDEPGFIVRGFFLSESQLRTLAEYEVCSQTGGEPDGLGIQYMAQGCLKIAEHPSLLSLEADEGRELFDRFERWKNSEANFPEEQLTILVKRLGAFLTRNFMCLWPDSMKSTPRSGLLLPCYFSDGNCHFVF